MIRLLLPICLTVCSSVLFAADELPEIFNGKDLSGWHVPEPNPWWSVSDGVLVGKQDPAAKGNVLETNQSYGDVLVEAEARWEGDIDSGIFLRKGQKWQCQFGVSRSLKRDMTGSVYTPKEHYVAEAKGVEAVFKKGDWNKYRIEARKDHYRIWLNDTLVVDADISGYNEPGPVGLQIHPGVKDMKVEFRNIKAKALE